VRGGGRGRCSGSGGSLSLGRLREAKESLGLRAWGRTDAEQARFHEREHDLSVGMNAL